MEDRTKEEIVNEEEVKARKKEEFVNGVIKRAEACGMAKDWGDVVIFLENEIEEYRKKIHSLEECYKIAREDLDEERAERMKVMKELQKRIRNEGSDQKAHPDVVEALKKSLRKEKELSETLQIRAVSLDDLSKGLQKENNELTEKVQELEAELADAGAVIENKARSEKRLNDDIIAKNIQIEELKSDLCKAESERDELQDRAERAEKEIRETKTIGEIEHGAFYPDGETVITINRKPDEIISVSVIFASPNEEGGEEDGED